MNPMFYFLLALTSVLAATTDAVTPVLDYDGDIIDGGSYYVYPAKDDPAGGLGLIGRDDNICPLDIVQINSWVENGIPVKFSNWSLKVPFVPESQNLNIMMDIAATACDNSTYWRVGELDEMRWQTFVVGGPQPKDHEKDSFKSFFRIKKDAEVANAYNFEFCPEDYCSNVGIFTDEIGVRRLALTSEPFSFAFFNKEKIYDATKLKRKMES